MFEAGDADGTRTRAAGSARSGCAPYQSILQLPDALNVRGNLLADPGKKRIKPTDVYRDTLESLLNDPADFEVKHGGFAIVATRADIIQEKNIVNLHKPSIINGAQSQGAIADWVEKIKDQGLTPFPVHPRFEIVVVPNLDFCREVSVTRNNQVAVKALSIATARHQLDDLAEAMSTANPEWRLQKDESETGDGLIDPQKVIQVATALMPAELSDPTKPTDTAPKKVYSYSQRAKCLRDFVTVYECARDGNKQDLPDKDRELAAERYKYFVDIAPQAWETYQQFVHHRGWSGMYLRKGVEREGNVVQEVADGLVFPIVSALSVFVEKRNGKWGIYRPPTFDDGILLRQVKMALGNKSINGNPWNLGKSPDAWAQIYAVAWTFKEMQAQFAEQYAKVPSRRAAPSFSA